MGTCGTLVVGLGNPILGDDGVGWRVAEEVQRRLQSPIPSPAPLRFGGYSHQSPAVLDERLEIEVDYVSLGGLSLMERMVGYQRVILIDAITTGQQPVGSVSRFPLDALPDLAAGHSSSAHDTSLKTALRLGHSMGAQLPEDVTVVAIEAQSLYDFSEELTPAIAAAVPEATRLVIEAIGLSDPRHGIDEED
jgi:hydrogenase maturation protease